MYLEERPAAQPTVDGTSVRVYDHPFRSWPVDTPAPHLRPPPASRNASGGVPSHEGVSSRWGRGGVEPEETGLAKCGQQEAHPTIFSTFECLKTSIIKGFYTRISNK